jgi:hypothetical protein
MYLLSCLDHFTPQASMEKNRMKMQKIEFQSGNGAAMMMIMMMQQKLS